MEDADVEDRLDAVRRRTRLWCVEKEERELSVEELGVEGLMSEGTFPGRAGDDSLRWYVRGV
jgi:hypothetical protein